MCICVGSYKFHCFCVSSLPNGASTMVNMAAARPTGRIHFLKVSRKLAADILAILVSFCRACQVAKMLNCSELQSA